MEFCELIFIKLLEQNGVPGRVFMSTLQLQRIMGETDH